MNKFVVNENLSHIRVYSEFLINLPPEHALMISYLISIQGMSSLKSDDDNYFRVATSFIQERLDWSDKVIRKILSDLQEMGLIEIQIRNGLERKRYAKTRWIKLNFKALHEMLGDAKQENYTCD